MGRAHYSRRARHYVLCADWLGEDGRLSDADVEVVGPQNVYFESITNNLIVKSFTIRAKCRPERERHTHWHWSCHPLES